jgi:hypothetical protein
MLAWMLCEYGRQIGIANFCFWVPIFKKKLQQILSVIIGFLVNGFPTVGTIYLTQSPKVALVLLLQHLMSTEAGGGREVGGVREFASKYVCHI